MLTLVGLEDSYEHDGVLIDQLEASAAPPDAAGAP
jgi:hypothetical protein